MGVPAQKLRIGQVVEVDRRLYDVVADGEGGVTLEPAITVTMKQSYRETGGRAASPHEVDVLLGDIPTDGEG